jgi:hypothetical protein
MTQAALESREGMHDLKLCTAPAMSTDQRRVCRRVAKLASAWPSEQSGWSGAARGRTARLAPKVVYLAEGLAIVDNQNVPGEAQENYVVPCGNEPGLSLADGLGDDGSHGIIAVTPG